MMDNQTPVEADGGRSSAIAEFTTLSVISGPLWGNCGAGSRPTTTRTTKRAGQSPSRPEMSEGLLSERSPVRLWPGAPTQESRSGRPMGSSPALLFCRR